MSWLWGVDDLDLRLTFARANEPADFLTVLARMLLPAVTGVLTLALFPVDKIMRLVGRALTALILGLFVLIGIHGLWFIIWIPLMGTSWLWLRYPWTRPVLFLPGLLIATVGHIFLMLVPDPQKNAKYMLMTREWPLSWHLWKPSEAYFEANPTWRP